jgi:hypothetical protein
MAGGGTVLKTVRATIFFVTIPSRSTLLDPRSYLAPQEKGGAINLRKLLAFCQWLGNECFFEYWILGIITGMGPATWILTL